MQASGDGQDTPKKELEVAPGGSGIGWIVQFAPFQRSASNVATVVPLPAVPTAMHAVGDVHDTPYSPGAASTAAVVGAAGARLERAAGCP